MMRGGEGRGDVLLMRGGEGRGGEGWGGVMCVGDEGRRGEG